MAPKALKVTEPFVSCCWILSLPPLHGLQSCSHGLCNRWWEDIKTWWCNYAGIAKLLEKKTKNHIMLRRQKNKMERRKDTEEKRHSHQSTFYLFCLSCLVFEENLAARRQWTRSFWEGSNKDKMSIFGTPKSFCHRLWYPSSFNTATTNTLLPPLALALPGQK